MVRFANGPALSRCTKAPTISLVFHRDRETMLPRRASETKPSPEDLRRARQNLETYGLMPEQAHPFLSDRGIKFCAAEKSRGGTEIIIDCPPEMPRPPLSDLEAFFLERFESIFGRSGRNPRIKVDDTLQIEPASTLGEGVHIVNSRIVGKSHVEGDVLVWESWLEDAAVIGMVEESLPESREVSVLSGGGLFNAVIYGAVNVPPFAEIHLEDAYIEGALERTDERCGLLGSQLMGGALPAREAVGEKSGFREKDKRVFGGLKKLRPQDRTVFTQRILGRPRSKENIFTFAVALTLWGISTWKPTADEVLKAFGISDPAVQTRVRFMYRIAQNDRSRLWRKNAALEIVQA